MQPSLSPEDYSTLAALLRETIAADRFRCRHYRGLNGAGEC